MTLMLVNFEPEIITEYSPSWTSFAKSYIFEYLHKRGLPTGSVKDHDNLLFIGETSPYIQLALAQKKRYSILLFLPNPFHVLSEMAILGADTLYTISSEHEHLLRTWLTERFGGNKTFNILNWSHLPKPFEPPVRSKKLIGVIEPDFNTSNIFNKLFTAFSSTFNNALYHNPCDVAFYTYHNDTYINLQSHNTNKVPIYQLDDVDASPLVHVNLMPNALMTMDAFKYNPVLSSWAQRIPVIRPEWASHANTITKTATSMAGLNSGDYANQILVDFVNQLDKIEELGRSSRIQDDLIRASLLGDLYGYYSDFRHVSKSS